MVYKNILFMLNYFLNNLFLLGVIMEDLQIEKCWFSGCKHFNMSQDNNCKKHEATDKLKFSCVRHQRFKDSPTKKDRVNVFKLVKSV